MQGRQFRFHAGVHRDQWPHRGDVRFEFVDLRVELLDLLDEVLHVLPADVLVSGFAFTDQCDGDDPGSGDQRGDDSEYPGDGLT